MLAANRAMTRFLAGVPDKLAGQLRTPAQWRAHALRRVRRQWDRTADPVLAELLSELESHPAPPTTSAVPAGEGDIVTPMRLATDAGELSLLYTVTVFGSPRDVTLDEIAIETFFPAGEATLPGRPPWTGDVELTHPCHRHHDALRLLQLHGARHAGTVATSTNSL